MPQVLAAVVYWGAYWATQTTIGAIIAKAAITLATSFAFGKLQGKQSAPFQALAREITTTSRNPLADRRIVYGEMRLGGSLVFARSTGSRNDFLHMVVVFAGHEVESITDIQLNERSISNGQYNNTILTHDRISFTSNGFINNVPIEGVDGLGHTTYDYGGVSFDGVFHSNEVIYISGSSLNDGWYRILDTPDQDVTIGFLRVRRIDGGSIVNEDLGASVTISKRYAEATVYTGTAGQTADPELVALIPEWTSNHRLRGLPYAYVKLAYHPDIFPTGIPNITGLVKGKNDIYDPRTATTGWTDNWALCVRDYLTYADGLGADSAEVNDTAFIAAANISDESVVTPVGSQSRYTCNGVVNLSESPGAVIDKLLTAGAGSLTYVQGQYKLHAGAYTTPTVTLTADDLRGPIKMRPRVSRKNLFNAVKGVYMDERQWQPADFQPITNSTYETQDGGERIYRDIEMPFTIDRFRARRIGKIALEKSRQGIIVEMPCNMSAMQFAPMDTVMLTLSQFGWTSKVFRVMEWNLQPDFGVDLVLQEEASASYTWDGASETDLDPAPDTEFPNPFSVLPISDLTIESGTGVLVIKTDGTIASRMKITFSESGDAFVVGYEIGWRLDGDIWHTQTVSAASPFYVNDVEDGELYNIRVRAVNSMGVHSEYVYADHTVVGKTALPADVPWFDIDGNLLRWGDVSDLDLYGYEIRYQQGVNYSYGDAVPLHTGILTSSPYLMATRPSGLVTLMIKSVDTSGNYSENTASIVLDLGDPIVANVVEYFDDHADGFPGTITNGTVNGSTGDLEADSQTPLMWKDDAADMWSYTNSLMWAAVQYAQMTYERLFTVTSALAGSVMTISQTITGINWSIKYRIDGTSLMWNTDSGVPMWTDDASAFWSPPADYQSWPGSVSVENGRYEFKITTGQGVTQGAISGLTFNVDAPDVDETLADVVISAGGTRLPITETYNSIKVVNITLQDDGGSAETARVIDKDPALGPLVKCFNSAGTSVAGTIDATIQGY